MEETGWRKLAAVVSIVALLAWGASRLPNALTAAKCDTYIGAVVENEPIIFCQPVAALELVDGYLDIQGHQLTGPHSEELLSVHIPNPKTGGRWPLRSSGRGAWAGHFVRDIPTDHTEYHHTDDTLGGAVWVTSFDPKQHIIEGAFEFDGNNNSKGVRRGPDTLRVRGGTFRARYRVIPADAYRERSVD
jgi:hypothetical protein